MVKLWNSWLDKMADRDQICKNKSRSGEDLEQPFDKMADCKNKPRSGEDLK